MTEEKNAIETRPCPFCAGKAVVYDIWKNGHNVWKVMCGTRVDCCAILNDFDTPEDAIKAWNGTGNSIPITIGNQKASDTDTGSTGSGDTIAAKMQGIIEALAQSESLPTFRKVKEDAQNLLKQLNQ